MTSRLRESDGFTLIEVMMACSLMIVVIGATLGALDVFTTQASEADYRNESQDQARSALDTLAHELRNVAGSQADAVGVTRAQPNDLIFTTVDPTGPNAGTNGENIQRVRYCVAQTAAGDWTLWRQLQQWTTSSAPAPPSATDCPGSGWDSQRQIVDHVVNGSRPIWTFDSSVTAETGRVATRLFVDSNGSPRPGPTELSTEVFLRNENRPPVASFTDVAIGLSHAVLNGTGSDDPEGEQLTYDWYVGGVHVGSGSVFDYGAPGPGTISVTLRVTDPSGLTGNTTRTVTVK